MVIITSHSAKSFRLQDIKIILFFIIYIFGCQQISGEWLQLPVLTPVQTTSPTQKSTFQNFVKFTPKEHNGQNRISFREDSHAKKNEETNVKRSEFPSMKGHATSTDKSPSSNVVKSTWKKNDCALIKNNVTFHIFEPSFKESLDEFQKAWNTSDTVSEKNLKNLTDLQITILSSIKKESDEVRRGSRELRDIGPHSIEGSLTTISLLTFAVFLIKLVKQYILGYNNTILATTGITGATILRQKRTLDDRMFPLVLKSLYDFKHARNL